MARGAVLSVAALVVVLAVCASAQTGFTWRNLQPNGPWVTQHVYLSTTDGTWHSGANATLILEGAVHENITAGHVDMQIYELDVATYVYRADFDYFQCHGYPEICDPCLPKVVTYSDCEDPVAGTFTLVINFFMPPQNATGDFTVSLVSGHDFPKEIVIEVGYNFSSSVAAGPALLPSA